MVKITQNGKEVEPEKLIIPENVKKVIAEIIDK
jgi:hypothetical protein